MPVPPRFGVFAGHGGTSPATFVGNSYYGQTATTQAVSFPGGAQSGDLAIIHAVYCSAAISITGGAGGWSTTDLLNNPTYNYNYCVTWKVLAGGDLGGVTVNNLNSGGVVMVVVYRGATTATQKATALSGVTGQVALAGFVKNAASKLIVSFVNSRRNTDTPAPPGTWTIRGADIVGSFFVGAAADVQPASYTNSSAVNWTGFAADNNFGAGFLYELT